MKADHYKDFTIKARLTALTAIEMQIKAMPHVFSGLDVQTDTYFETTKGKLKWRQGTIENLITHYERIKVSGVERSVVYRYDVNPSKEEIDQLFSLHRPIGTIRKERKIYWIGNVKIHLDCLANGDKFIELEAADKENKFTDEELKAQCLFIKRKLGIAGQDLIPTGYFVQVNGMEK